MFIDALPQKIRLRSGRAKRKLVSRSIDGNIALRWSAGLLEYA